MDAIQKVIESWRARGIALNEPAESQAVAKLAGLFGGPVPSEVSRFYELADGMPDHGTDGWHLSFWSVERVLREHDVVIRGEETLVAFADFLIYSHCLRLARMGSGVVVSVDGSPERFPSLSSFFDRYLADPGAFGMLEGG